ncbi:MAG: ABC transporter ATP-binding protein [Halothiobacillaceae bacterium]|jgi:iron complex transport system ATP-binding protein|nr:ABC transporter ATP-binding protein [Halothiobacillaceae bacterium]
MLKVSGLGIRYADWILRGLDFTLGAGEVMAILGPNGRGKSSLMRAIAGLTRPDEGRVECAGDIAYVPQFITPGFDMSALDLVLTGRSRQVGWMGSPGARDREIARDCLRRLDIERFAQRGINHLSGGERQLVLIARALASGCHLMLLDEPASALDFHNQAIILDVMRELAQSDGMTVVFTTHAPQHALEIANRTLLLHDARDFAYGPTPETVTSAQLSRLYHLPIRRLSLDEDGHRIETAIPLYHAIARRAATGDTRA